jgi:Na+/H+ antiporter NhaD/arsenite permease-like protein
MENCCFSEWLTSHVVPQVTEFFSFLAPWLLLTLVSTICDYRFAVQAWKADSKRDKSKKPKGSKYFNKIVNCFLLVLLAGCFRITADVEMGVTALSTTMLVIFAAMELMKAWNSYLRMENTGKRINVLKALTEFFKLKDIVEDDKDENLSH